MAYLDSLIHHWCEFHINRLLFYLQVYDLEDDNVLSSMLKEIKLVTKYVLLYSTKTSNNLDFYIKICMTVFDVAIDSDECDDKIVDYLLKRKDDCKTYMIMHKIIYSYLLDKRLAKEDINVNLYVDNKFTEIERMQIMNECEINRWKQFVIEEIKT